MPEAALGMSKWSPLAHKIIEIITALSTKIKGICLCLGAGKETFLSNYLTLLVK